MNEFETAMVNKPSVVSHRSSIVYGGLKCFFFVYITPYVFGEFWP